MHRIAITGLILAACSSPKSPPATPAPLTTASGEVAVPRAAAPTIDGKVDATEWASATTSALGCGVTARLMHDGAKVYIGVSGLGATEMGFVCVFVAEPEQVAIFHASAQLGTASYVPTGDAYEPRSKAYQWKQADALLAEEGWMATTVRGDDPAQQEVALTFERLGLPAQPKRIAIGYFTSKRDAPDLSAAKVLVWPTGLGDAVATVELVAGFNPDHMKFDPARWAILRPQ